MMILWVFVSVSCFASTFCVPYACQCEPAPLPQERAVVMQDPASVGLQVCEVRQGLCDEVLVMRNLEGVSLLCSVNNHVVHDGDRLFSINADKGGCGDVYFNDRGKRKFAEVYAGLKTVATHDLGDFNLWSQTHSIQYDFGEESVIVRRFLGNFVEGKEVFVSATIAYNDIRTIKIGCGTGQLSLCSGQFNGLGLFETSTIKTLCLGAPGTFSFSDEWDCDSRRPMTAENGNKVVTMKVPGAVGLQRCEIVQGLVEDMIFVTNLDEGRLFLSMKKPVVCHDDWIFSASYNGENLGSVWFLSEDQFNGSLEIRSEGEIKASHHIEARLWRDREWCRYNIGRKSLTVRKFFCYGFAAIFVSATIAYDDIKNVVIRCGYGGEDWAFGGVQVGALSRGFGQMPKKGVE